MTLHFHLTTLDRFHLSRWLWPASGTDGKNSAIYPAIAAIASGTKYLQVFTVGQLKPTRDPGRVMYPATKLFHPPQYLT